MIHRFASEYSAYRRSTTVYLSLGCVFCLCICACGGRTAFDLAAGNGNDAGTFADAGDAGNARPLIATAIAAGDGHSCAIVPDGSMRCWGFNDQGQLGDGTETNSPLPAHVLDITNANGLFTGMSHNCAVLDDGTVWWWGTTDAVGARVHSSAAEPIATQGVNSARVAACGVAHSCALLDDATVQCWGTNDVGELGIGTMGSMYNPFSSTHPVVPNALAVGVGGFISCAVLGDGSAQCWGNNGYGQLGNGTTTDSSVPVSVMGISNATSIAVSEPGAAHQGHVCALLSDARVLCWGRNSSGQLGDGTTTDRSVPVQVLGISTAVAIAAGSEHSCAVLNDGSVRCWGSAATSPVAVVGITSATAVAAGQDRDCVLLGDGTVQCWGNGMLGDGGTQGSLTPVTVRTE